MMGRLGVLALIVLVGCKGPGFGGVTLTDAPPPTVPADWVSIPADVEGYTMSFPPGWEFQHMSASDLEGYVKSMNENAWEMLNQKKADVDAAFVRLCNAYFANITGDGWLAVATHDARMVREALRAAATHGVTRERFEFQLLYGIRNDLQRALRDRGYRVRVYVPYGADWYPYMMRRLAERPANLWFFLKSAFRR